ncbi:MAG: hypothetical protein AB7N24_10240 [Dehalococcoidia bacterium]
MKRFLLVVRGLSLGLSISAMNLLGLFLTILVIGGLGSWSRVQFVGAFGVFELGTAFAFIVAPNVWRLPVLEAETSNRTNIKLALSVIAIPHWAGGAKALAGLAMVVFAARSEGISPATVGIVPLIVCTNVFVVAVSAMAARWGVARVDLDVLQIVVRRPRHRDLEIPGISIVSSVVQIVLGAFTLPVVKIAPPSVLFRPELAPSNSFLVVMALAATASVLGTVMVWWGRLALNAEPAQQRKAEDPA